MNKLFMYSMFIILYSWRANFI